MAKSLTLAKHRGSIKNLEDYSKIPQKNQNKCLMAKSSTFAKYRG